MTDLLLCTVAVLAIIAAAAVWRRQQVARPPSLYDRLGGIFPIAAVVDHFSDAVLQSPLVGIDSPNPQLRQWSREQSASRLPGLKFQRTLWVCDAVGGPDRYHGTKPGNSRLDLENAHRRLHITPAEFDEVARLLDVSLDHYQVPAAERALVLGAFMAHKREVTAGSRAPAPSKSGR